MGNACCAQGLDSEVDEHVSDWSGLATLFLQVVQGNATATVFKTSDTKQLTAWIASCQPAELLFIYPHFESAPRVITHYKEWGIACLE